MEIWTPQAPVKDKSGKVKAGGVVRAVRSLLVHDVKVKAREGLRVSGLCLLPGSERLVVGYEYCASGDRMLAIYKYVHLPLASIWWCGGGSFAALLSCRRLSDSTSPEQCVTLEARHSPPESEAVFTSLTATTSGLIAASTWQGKLVIYDPANLKRVRSALTFVAHVCSPFFCWWLQVHTIEAHGEADDEDTRVVALEGGQVATLGGAGELKIWR